MNQAGHPALPSGPPAAAPTGLNLLRFRPIAALVRKRWFPAGFQAGVLCVFVALAVLGWNRFTPAGVNAKLYAKTNLVNLVVWGLWWPAIVWITFWLGRAWCVVCPLELVSRLAHQLGAKTGVPQRPLAGWLARGSLAVLFFALLQMLVPGVQIHRVPHYTALFLVTALSLAFATGLFLKHRAFCRGFCPVSLLLSAYGRGGMLAVRPAALPGCPTAAAPNARACPSLLNPGGLKSGKDCLICGECLKADTGGTMQLLLRRPYAADDAREPLASWPLTIFVMIVSGFVTYELSGVWPAAEAVFLWPPKLVGDALHASAAQGWIQGLWTIVIFPLALWLVLGGATMLTGGAKKLSEAWRRIALPLAVVVATGHLAKAMEKFTSWAGFLPHALAEPTGVQTALQMQANSVPQPAPWLAPQLLATLAMLLVATGLALAVREARLTDPQTAHRRLLPVLLLGGFYFFFVLGWSGWLR